MKKVDITFLPSVKDNYFDDKLIIDWSRKLNDSFDFINTYIPKNAKEARTYLKKSNAAFGVITKELIGYCENIEWLQAPQAAPPPDFYFDELVNHPMTVTNFRGIYNDHISHHIMAMVLSFSKSLNLYIHQQSKRLWNPIKSENGSTRYMPEMKIIIIGLGGIGDETARLCNFFGSEIIGIDERRKEKPNYVSKLLKPDHLANYLSDADFVISTIPHTPNTEKIFNYDFFKKMKKSAFFINIGRGKTTVLNDLVKAIKNKNISGAGLDVFENEPLPTNHELWEFENVIITPHIAAYDVPYLDERRYEVIKKNCINFSEGKKLINIVEKSLWY
tara:strand:+ start:600 stop:1595 length:996 start_codon:yes stop_codon:yes gene_type:complete